MDESNQTREVVEAAESKARQLADIRDAKRADLPLRFWRQQAILVSPVTPLAVPIKALERGTQPMARMLERVGVAPEDLAERMNVGPNLVSSLLDRPVSAPVVVLDLEDTQPVGDRADLDAVRGAVTALTSGTGTVGPSSPLRFVRIRSLDAAGAVKNLHALVSELADRAEGTHFPLDGLVYPKVDHPEEIDLLFAILTDIENAVGLREGSLRVTLLIESGWSAAQLPQIIRQAVPRLSSVVVGLVDYSADLGLPTVVDDHPLATSLRANVVNIAGAVGVPAIDGMTLQFPVVTASADRRANRKMFLDRMALVHRDTLRAAEFGMGGKLVGHPAQLYGALLAWRAFSSAAVAKQVEHVEAYKKAVQHDGRGVHMITDAMSDRATDRQARSFLRRATALGLLDPERALAMGIIGPDELTEAERLFAAEQGV